MATRVQKIKVSVFLLVAAGLLVAVFLLLAGYRQGSRVPYNIEFEESVLGLGVGSTVEYLGVPVGVVNDISVRKGRTAYVEVLIDQSKVQLHEGTTASLVIYSLATGALNVSLKGSEPNAPPLPPGSEIPTEKSFTETVRGSAQEMIATARDLVDTIDRVAGMIESSLQGLEEGAIADIVANVKAISEDSRTVVAKSSETIDMVQKDLDQGMKTIERLADDFHKVSNKVNELVEVATQRVEAVDVNSLNDSATRIADNLTEITQQMKTTLESLNTATEALLYKVNNVEYTVRGSLNTANETFQSIQDLAEFLRENPSALVRGRGRVKEIEE